MKTILHISDLHFGRTDPRASDALIEDVLEIRPTVVVVSGDLTQRALRSQFVAARAYLNRIPFPLIVVPGNHDIPLHDLAGRFLRPLARYRRFISNDLAPLFCEEGLAVLGINTTWPFNWKSGRMSQSHVRLIRSAMGELESSVFKIVVAHHPFAFTPPNAATDGNTGRISTLLDEVEECGVDVVLAGHLHVASHDVGGPVYFPTRRRSMLCIKAGTAISTRTRSETNSYNVLAIEPPRLSLTLRAWNGECFVSTCRANYRKREGKWRSFECGAMPL